MNQIEAIETSQVFENLIEKFVEDAYRVYTKKEGDNIVKIAVHRDTSIAVITRFYKPNRWVMTIPTNQTSQGRVRDYQVMMSTFPTLDYRVIEKKVAFSDLTIEEFLERESDLEQVDYV